MKESLYHLLMSTTNANDFLFCEKHNEVFSRMPKLPFPYNRGVFTHLYWSDIGLILGRKMVDALLMESNVFKVWWQTHKMEY